MPVSRRACLVQKLHASTPEPALGKQKFSAKMSGRNHARIKDTLLFTRISHVVVLPRTSGAKNTSGMKNNPLLMLVTKTRNVRMDNILGMLRFANGLASGSLNSSMGNSSLLYLIARWETEESSQDANKLPGDILEVQ